MNFGRYRAAVGSEEEHRCSEYVFHDVAVTPVIDGKLEGVTAMRWRGWDTRRKAGRWLSPAFLSASTVVTQYGGRSSLLVEAYPRRRTPVLPTYLRTTWTGCRTNHGGNRSPAVKLPRWRPDPLGLLYHQKFSFSFLLHA